MKKLSPRQLVVRRETLRALAGVELTRVLGGFDSGKDICPAVVTTVAPACANPGG